jgi:SAM-dependent methyltransferase
MFSKTAALYDQIYSFKNYAEECAQITERIRAIHPTAKTVLDVACGTGEHAKFLSQDFRVDGIDLEPGFVEIAQSKNPGSRFWHADMTDFALGQSYDVVQCLFSSIGYLKQPAQVVAALKCFASHLTDNGVILVEPWFTPDLWESGVPWMVTVDKPDLKICRMNVSEQEGNLSRIRFQYLIARNTGIEHFHEDHELALYTVEEMLECFRLASLTVTHDPQGVFGRGLYTARA